MKCGISKGRSGSSEPGGVSRPDRRENLVKRFMRTCAAILAGTALAMTGVPNAGADTQRQIECSAPVFNDTVKYGKYDVDAAFISREIAAFQAMAPAAKVHVHAYENIPGGSLDAFMELSRQQCSEWGDNTVAVVYGRDIDDIAIFESYGFLAIDNKESQIMKGVKVGLGPDKTQVSSDAVTSVLVDALIGARYYLTLTGFYNEETGIYTAPVRQVQEPEREVPLPVMIAAVIAGFGAFGLIAHLVARRSRR